MSFVHLHTHSHYSLLDGLSKVDQLVARAKEYGMPALALTDHGNLYGAIEFYTECLKADIKPIIGVEAYMAERTRFDKDAGIDNKRYHLTLLAQNTVGYHNLIKLVSQSHIEGMYYKPRMDLDLLARYSEGIICLSGCPGSRVARALTNGNYDTARELVGRYTEIFGRDRVFVEVMAHNEIDQYAAALPSFVRLAHELDLPIVGTWDSHYLHRDDAEAHKTLLAINTSKPGNEKSKKGDYSFIDSDEAREKFKDIPGAFENTMRVADMVNIDIDLKSRYFPVFPIPENTTADDVLRAQAYEGARTKNIELTNEMRERIEYELSVIKMKGYATYFLAESDFVVNAKRMGIFTNTRGSAAGSFVSYLIGIVALNPLPYRLPFQRFLNPDRPSLPDIDLDIADNRRDDLIDYAKQKYGDRAVAQVGTFGTMAARGAVRDVARALGYPYGVGDKIAKLIPMGSQGFPMTIEHAMELEPELTALYETDRGVREIIDMARKIEGNVRHISVHAAGVVISPTGDITDFSPIQWDPKGEGKIITQYDMYTGDSEGVVNLPKFDILGLRNLNFIAETIDRIKKIRGIDLDIDNISVDDAETYASLARGETMGVFQLASDGMTHYIKELKPSTLEDIIAMVALYRPGPLQFIPAFIERKHNPRLISYLHPDLKEVLERTYGILVYQDDLMMMAVKFAGYSWGDADKLRKAVGKKIPEEMAKQEIKFIEGCVEHSKWDKKIAEEVWSWMLPFAAYGFNKAHAASYALLAYKTAYLKTHYPAEYMTACMTAESGDIETCAEYINEARRMGFEILPPSINESFSDFTVIVENGEVTKKIRFGLRNIKNFGDEIGKAIIHERKSNGAYSSLENFLERITHRNLNKKSLEALIMSGAMDEFGERGMLLANCERLLTYNKESVRDKLSDQLSLFGANTTRARLDLEHTDPLSERQYLDWEKELLGIYVTGHPLEKYRNDKRFSYIGAIVKGVPIPGMNPRKQEIAGIIESVKITMTKKNGEKMALFKLRDFSAAVECVIFPKAYQESKNCIEVDKMVVVKGSFERRDEREGFIVESVREISTS